MVRWRPLAIVLLVAVLLTALGGLALAGNKYGTAKASKSKEVTVKVKQEVRHGKQEVRLVKERGDDDDDVGDDELPADRHLLLFFFHMRSNLPNLFHYKTFK